MSPPAEAALRERVRRRFASAPVDDAPELARDVVVRDVARLLGEESPLLPAARRDALVERITEDIVGLGPLAPLAADPSVTEIMVNGGRECWVERSGRLVAVPLEVSAADVVAIVDRLVAPLGLRLDRASPMVDARLPDGSRLHAVIPPLAIDGPCLTLRRFSSVPLTLDAFDLGPHASTLLEWVREGRNIVVAGGTGSGKTTLLNALSVGVAADERVVTIEETAELRWRGAHVVRLEARPANGEGAGEVTVRQLVRTALRMRPDRLVVGEVRGGEALDMLQALNTGHDGSLTTVHANGPAEALQRLGVLALQGGLAVPWPAVRLQLRAAVDLVVQVARVHGGARAVVRVAELAAPDARDGLHVVLERRQSALVECGSVRRPVRRAGS